jgi:valyl-tRNA synthetase
MSDKFKLSKTYEPSEVEGQIYKSWLESGGFHAVPDRRDERYVIMMPLPNVTGALHMGHAMDNVMQDLLIRWHRMMGDNTLWLPGTDHAGIATQAVVEKRMKELEGLTRHEVGRQGLIDRIWKWKDQFQSRIVQQQQRMGCSADWQRQRFTMDKVCSRAVRNTFFKMYTDGLIFRGKRLVNWDPFLLTSISDDEVYHETVKGHFWHLRYPVIDPQKGEPTEVIVATTRPETMLGDTAVAVHPDPESALEAELERRKQQLEKASAKEKTALEEEITNLEERQRDVLPGLIQLRDMANDGRKVMLPLMQRPIPLVLDVWANPALGSGCVKITPAHDPNDYEVWKRHKEEIDIINILNPDGTLNGNAGKYKGLDRFDARKKVVADLEAQDLLPKVEDREIEIGHSDRSKSPIEPYLSDQWFIFMGDREEGVLMGRGTDKEHKKSGLVQAAIDATTEGKVTFHPERFAKTYLDWLEEKRDWPVSRQLWWGHRIPVWSRQLPFKDVKEAAKTLINDILGDVWPHKAAVRVVGKEDGEFTLIDSLEKIDGLSGKDDDLCLLDICLVEDDDNCLDALDKAGYQQDPDVLDTWFSSAIWPHSTLGWPHPESADTEGGASMTSEEGDTLNYYYPGSCLVTARDIITLWVARMVITGFYNMGDIPFSDVFIHANILDGKGERMSKSKGNGIDPVDIIEAYGTDAMRYVLCDMQTGNQDIRLPVTAICPECGNHNELAKSKHGKSVFTYMCLSCKKEYDVLGTMPGIPSARLISERFMEGKKFCTKLWNTARFALGNLEDTATGAIALEQMELEDRWILAALNQAVNAVTRGLEEYNPSVALGAARDFMWGQLCDWYLELIKPRLAEGGESAGIARRVLAYCLDKTLRLLHPFVPFITEFLWQQLKEQVPELSLPGLTRDESGLDLLLVALWPQAESKLDNPELLSVFADLQAATSGVREVRSTQQVSPKQELEVTIKPPQERASDLESQAHVIQRLANVSALHIDAEAKRPRGAASRVVGDLQIFVHDLIDDDVERKKLQADLEKIQKSIKGNRAKLANENFVSRAPEKVVEQHRQQLARLELQEKSILQSLEDLA